MAPRTFFRYFPTKEEVALWAEFPPMLAGFVAARPDDEPALEALQHGIVDGLAAVWDQDEERERMLERLRLAFRTPAPPPDAPAAGPLGAELAEILADRLGERPDNLEVRIIAAAVAAAVWVAAEEWQAQDHGDGDLGALIDQALSTVLERRPYGPHRPRAHHERTPRPRLTRRPPRHQPPIRRP